MSQRAKIIVRFPKICVRAHSVVYGIPQCGVRYFPVWCTVYTFTGPRRLDPFTHISARDCGSIRPHRPQPAHCYTEQNT